MALIRFKRLERQLTLFDVYVISTGAMISSGFFLLPGLAATYTGPGVVLAYLAAGLLILPAMLSQAELATAMPRAGGAYYFLDRTLGPLVGTIGGVGTWLALVLKSAFALIGIGAYASLVLEPAGITMPVIPIAIAATIAFAGLNIAGAKESSWLIRALVIALLSILALFAIHGLADVFLSADGPSLQQRFTPLLPNGMDGLLATVGLVFVSYIGLTKVASLAEEVKNPDRNIPLGMGLALATVTAVYVVGVFIMVVVLGTAELSGSLTPVADAAGKFTSWFPAHIGVWIMVVAAIVAFASTSNAGILAASRYPLAMARDRLFPDGFATTGRRGTPVVSILFTCTLLIFFLVVLNVEEVAKLASALQLLLFGLINVAVIVMRESRIESYDPGFRSPLYPWMQLVGLFVPLVLVAEMGWLPVLFTLGVTTACFAWYTYYAQHRIERDGAIYHVFERLGRRRFAGLDRELRDIMKEKGARAEDPFDQVVARAIVIDLPQRSELSTIIVDASRRLSGRLPAAAGQLGEAFNRGVRMGGTPVAHGAALLHTRLPGLDGSELALVRSPFGVELDIGEEDIRREAAGEEIHALFFLVSGEGDPGRHLRILAQLAGRIEDDAFMPDWLAGRHEQELKETLLRDDRFLSLRVRTGTKTSTLIGRPLQDLEMPEGALVVLIRRRAQTIVPRGRTVINDGDRLTIIGDPSGLRDLARRFGDDQ
jgi:amino acid transporter/mannitol/fructose-specific phosphotransferase system IIA component (Ntr-type)